MICTRRFFLYLVLLPLFLVRAEIAAAQTDSAGRTVSLRPAPCEPFLVAAGLIAYGATGLKVAALQRFNETIREVVWIRHPHKPVGIDDYLQGSPIAAVYGLSIAGIKAQHNIAERTVIVGLTALILRGVVTPVKKWTKEQRPDGSDLYAFPSGHTANAFAAAELLRKEYGAVSVWYGVGGYAAAAATGFLRMYNNRHWFTDVVAGAGVGIAATNLSYLVYPALKSIFVHKHTSSTLLLPVYQTGGAAICLVHVF